MQQACARAPPYVIRIVVVGGGGERTQQNLHGA